MVVIAPRVDDRGEMDDDVDPVPLHERDQTGGAGHVAVVVDDSLQRVLGPAHIAGDHELDPGVAHQRGGHVRPEEAGTAGHQHACRCVAPCGHEVASVEGPAVAASSPPGSVRPCRVASPLGEPVRRFV